MHVISITCSSTSKSHFLYYTLWKHCVNCGFPQSTDLSSGFFLFQWLLISNWKASENGATGVELDLEFTADGVPILMHDDTVDRTTNGSGPLNKLLFSELRNLDAAAKHRFRLDGKNDRLVFKRRVWISKSKLKTAGGMFVLIAWQWAFPRWEGPNTAGGCRGMHQAQVDHLLRCQRSSRWGTVATCIALRESIIGWTISVHQSWSFELLLHNHLLI